MLKEYALDPSLFSTWRDYQFYVGQFGAGHGRLISRFPKQWKQMVAQAAQTAKDIEYLRIEEALFRRDEDDRSQIDRVMLIRDYDYNKGHDWIRNANDENQKRPFHAIVSTQSDGNQTNVIIGDNIDPMNPPPLWIVPTSVQIEREPSEMANCVLALLSQCDEALFIDPYFGPGKRKHTEPLKMFLQAIASRGTRRMPSRVEYHGGNQDQDTTKYQSDLEQWVKPHLPAGATLSVVRWNKEQMHNRYILTDRGGVMFGQGLDDGRDSNVKHDTVSLLDDNTCAELMIDYSSQSTRLSWLNEIFSITGS